MEGPQSLKRRRFSETDSTKVWYNTKLRKLMPRDHTGQAALCVSIPADIIVDVVETLEGEKKRRTFHKQRMDRKKQYGELATAIKGELEFYETEKETWDELWRFSRDEETQARRCDLADHIQKLDFAYEEMKHRNVKEDKIMQEIHRETDKNDYELSNALGDIFVKMGMMSSNLKPEKEMPDKIDTDFSVLQGPHWEHLREVQPQLELQIKEYKATHAATHLIPPLWPERSWRDDEDVAERKNRLIAEAKEKARSIRDPSDYQISWYDSTCPYGPNPPSPTDSQRLQWFDKDPVLSWLKELEIEDVGIDVAVPEQMAWSFREVELGESVSVVAEEPERHMIDDWAAKCKELAPEIEKTNTMSPFMSAAKCFLQELLKLSEIV